MTSLVNDVISFIILPNFVQGRKCSIHDHDCSKSSFGIFQGLVQLNLLRVILARSFFFCSVPIYVMQVIILESGIILQTVTNIDFKEFSFSFCFVCGGRRRAA